MTSYSQNEGVMKIHNDFTLYFRVVPSGKRVVYYYTYDAKGIRTHGRSTGETTLTAARRKCNRLFKDGELAVKKRRVPTFAEFANGWWEEKTCPYLQKRLKRVNLTKSYLTRARQCTEKVLVPFFGSMRMDKIQKDELEKFLDKLVKDGLKNSTANSYYAIMKTMMVEAAEREIIVKNPTEKVKKLVENCKEIEIVTREEFKRLFTGDREKIWGSDPVAYTANKLAAVTGMRAGEVLGLKGGYLHDGYLFLCKQHDRYGYRDTKTKTQSNIPLPSLVVDELNELKKKNGDGYLFSVNGGGKPVTVNSLYNNFHKALVNIGIPKTEIKDRKLHLHAWRHFFNTELLKGGLTITQVQAITGHKSERMTKRYCHFDPAEFVKAKAVQEDLLKPAEKPEGETETGSNVLPFPSKENEKTRKQA